MKRLDQSAVSPPGMQAPLERMVTLEPAWAKASGLGLHLMELTHCGEGRANLKQMSRDWNTALTSSLPKLLLCTLIVLGTHLSKPLVTGVA